MIDRCLPLILLAALLGGCAMTPEYERPDAPVAADWPVDSAGDAGSIPAAQIAWRDFVRDDALRRTIELALDHNRDLRLAALNVEQARARFRVQRSELYPEINAGAGVARQRTSADFSPTGDAQTTTQYSVSAGLAAYELDFFGRVRSLRDQALESYLATEEAQLSARISLIAEVANQHLALRALREQLALSEQTLQAVERRFDITAQRHELGDVSALDVQTARARVESVVADIAAFSADVDRAGNALTLLVGSTPPADWVSGSALDEEAFLSDLNPGLPADLLRQRPDIRAAEHHLKAANANIGAARAAFFPRVVLTAAAGSEAREVSDLFTDPTRVWSFAPSITVPIFDGGNNRANLDLAEVGKRIEIARYEQTIQFAFREVADALATRRWIDDQVAAVRRLVDAQSKRNALAEARYDRGADSYLSVLLSQEDLYAAQQRLISVRFAQLANRVELYRALGGGWNDPRP